MRSAAGTAAEVLTRLSDPVRGEVVLVLEPQGSRLARAPNSGGQCRGRKADVEKALSALRESGLG